MPIMNFKKIVQPNVIATERKLVKEIIPTPFFINRELEEKDIVSNASTRVRVVQSFYKRHGYAQLGESLNNYIISNCNSIVLIKLIHYIAKTIKFTSNKIVLSSNNTEISNIVGINHLSRYIDELERQYIIRRTTKQNVYVVNHEMIFKGNYSDFINAYIEAYKNVPVSIDEKGRVILFNDINYQS